MTLTEFHNLHHGKMCFIAGASPSLRHVDFKTIKNFITIAVNSSIMKYPESDYYVTDDQGVLDWNYWRQYVLPSKCHKFLFREKLGKHITNYNDSEYTFYDHRYWSQEFNRDNMLVYSDPLVPIVGARTSVASAINIAFIMGCDPIVLLGMDNCFEDGKRYFWEFHGEPKAFQINKFSNYSRFPSYIDKKTNKTIDRHCHEYEKYWSHFAEANPQLLRGKILNSSVNSLLEIFPKVELDRILHIYGDRNVQR
jgi:hypothetical protein